MKCKIFNAMPKAHPAKGILPAGTILDDPQAFILVQAGAAEPADDECKAAHKRTPEQLSEAQRSYRRVSCGIHPDDYEAYDAGVMTGYNKDGSFKPGPNAPNVDEEEDEEEDDDDD